MGRGERWLPQEVKMLQEMVEQGMTADEIFRSRKFPERTHNAIVHEVSRMGFGGCQKKSSGCQITEAGIVDLESFVKRYVDAFNKLCDLTDYDKADLERFRLIHTYARDYPALLAEHERLKQVEEAMAEINRRLQALEAQASKQCS
jgi:hypothetical protein